MPSTAQWLDEIGGGDSQAIVRQFEDLYAGQTSILDWTDVPYSQANFTASGAMTWTVPSGAQVTYGYTRVGKAWWISVAVGGSSVGGTLSTTLRVRLPNGATAASATSTACVVFDNSGSAAVLGLMRALKGSSFIDILRFDTGNFAASTRNTGVQGQLLVHLA